MAGCECEIWQAVIGVIRLTYDAEHKCWCIPNTTEDGQPSMLLYTVCPWCGSKLTEEAGDAE